jgi:hypothetical protein
MTADLSGLEQAKRVGNLHRDKINQFALTMIGEASSTMCANLSNRPAPTACRGLRRGGCLARRCRPICACRPR